MSLATACSSGGSTAAQTTTTKFTDSCGREVEVPSKITRIVPSGALAQIALFALAPEMLVGLSNKWDSTASQYLDSQYQNLPVVGQFYGQNDLNMEEISKLDPQIIIDVGESKKTIVDDMNGIQQQVGIPTVHIEAKLDTMADAYRAMGKLLGKEKEAETLAKYCEDVNTKTKNIMDAIGEAGKTKLVYCTGENGLNVLAQGSFHAEVLDKISNNVAVVTDISSKGTGNPVDMEQLMQWDPDVILFAPGSIYSTVSTNEAWQNLKAIKNGTYYEVPNGPYNWMGNPPSVNRLMGMIWMTQLLYPQQAKYDGYKEAAEYYKLFYHMELTKDQYNALVANSLLKSAK
jgi:iron complex transport system substrate-binding protein